MDKSPLLDPRNQRSSDEVFYGILDHYYLFSYEDPELQDAKIRMMVGIAVYATTDHNTAKFLIRKNIEKVVEAFERQLMYRLYR